VPALVPLASLTPWMVLGAVGIGLLVFFAVSFGLTAYDVRRLRKRVEAHVPVDDAKEGSEDFHAATARIYAATERGLDRIRLLLPLIRIIERADSALRPGQLFYLMFGGGVGAAFVFGLIGVPAVLLLLIFFPVGAWVPYAILSVQASRRQKRFDEQLPQLLMSMAASIRVGHSFRQAMQAVVNEGHEPASKEFGRALLEADVGRRVDQALQEMAERLRSPNLEYVVQTVAIQQEVGGSLAGLFDIVADTTRQRQRFAKRVRGLTAQARISAYILTVMPIVAMGALALHGTSYVSPLFTTSTGRMLLIIAFVGVVIGGLILRKMVAFRMS
jgi:tight adherence protein B